MVGLGRAAAKILPMSEPAPSPSTGAPSSGVYGLSDYVRDVESVLDRHPALPIVVREVGDLTRRLVADDSWLGAQHRIGCEDSYTRHLLHRDRFNRFVVLSLVWNPGQATPIHDHDCWGIMGVMENQLEEVPYERLDDGSRTDYAELREREGALVEEGQIGELLPPYHEIHRIGNVSDKPSISIHIYGRDLDEINVFDLVTHKVSPMRIKYYGANCGGTEFMI